MIEVRFTLAGERPRSVACESPADAERRADELLLIGAEGVEIITSADATEGRTLVAACA